MITYLISKASTGKFRAVYLEWNEQWDDKRKGYVITRTYGQLRGKMVKAPDIVITVGKAGRTHKEQALLQYNSEKNKYLDKGYKELPLDPLNYTDEELNEFYGDTITDQNGFSKHMLAKPADKVQKTSINRIVFWYASRKIDGVRASFFFKNGTIYTASRGGKDFDPATMHIRKNKQFIEFFEKHPDYILDGELYKHGKSLQQISGAARLEKNAYDCDWLEYYIYDVMIPNMPFSERLKILDQIKEELNLGFDPQREWKEGELQVQMVPQEKVSGYDNIMKLHNKYVLEGWEGVVCRDPDKNYVFGKRTLALVKFKMYQDAEFKITGYELGLRGTEDMVFICETKDGISFKAKPWGDRTLKEEYIENFNTKCLGKMATVKYFYLSDDKVPLQPSVKCIRDYE